MNINGCKQEDVEIKRLVLKKIPIELSLALPRSYLQDTTIESYADYAANQYVFHIKSSLYGQKSHSEDETIECWKEFPASWVQALKERFLPGWLLNKFPVEMIRVPIVRKVIKYETKVCPHIKATSDGDHLEFFLADERF